MSTLPRPLVPRASLRAACVAAVGGCLAALVLFLAAPARGEVAEVGGTTVGLQAVNQVSYKDGFFEESFDETTEELTESFNPGPSSFRNVNGYPVLHGTNLYVVYWDPMARYNPEWEHLINTFMQSVGASSSSTDSVFAVDAQYTDATNIPAYNHASFHGAYTDTHPYPAKGCTGPSEITCLTDAQLRAELQEFIAAHSLPKGMGSVYYILTPPGVSVCIDGASTRCSSFERSAEEETANHYESESYEKAICSYHAAINPGGTPTGDAETILYGVVPWIAGSAGRSRGSLVTGQAAYCQGGGWNPTSKPTPNEREKIKARNAQEQEEFEKKSSVEKEELEAEKALQGPHDQEPNQLPCPDLIDGLCDAGLADLIAGQIGTEQQNIVTDPLLNAWHDSTGKEATDECRNVYFMNGIHGGDGANPESGAGTLSNQTLNGHGYYLNMAFDLATTLLPYPSPPCIPGVNVLPEFTAPNTVNSGETVSFDGMESNITLDSQFVFNEGAATKTYAKYRWEFGDGSPAIEGFAPGAPACETPWLSPCAASVLHSYQYGGTYQVTLTVTDTAGNVAITRHPITVVGPAAPSSSGSPGGGSAGAAATPGSSGAPTSTSASGGTPGVAIRLPAPVAAYAVLSRSLHKVVRGGILVAYSVNEQVAGRFEVMISRTLARHLGLSGQAASGLPAGSQPQIVVARALVVTAAGGHSRVVISLSKHNAKRLARLHKVTMMLRLTVRNAARVPLSTTVLSAFTLR